MFNAVDSDRGKTFEFLMLIFCVCLLAGGLWIDLHSSHVYFLKRTLAFYGSLLTAIGYFAHSLMTDDVTGKFFFSRKKHPSASKSSKIEK